MYYLLFEKKKKKVKEKKTLLTKNKKKNQQLSDRAHSSQESATYTIIYDIFPVVWPSLKFFNPVKWLKCWKVI